MVDAQQTSDMTRLHSHRSCTTVQKEG